MSFCNQLLLGAALTGALMAMPANAQIEMLDYKAPGDQSIIYDAALGLEFLRLPLTYQVAQADLPALFPDFRIAHQNEVEGLLIDLGLTGLASGGISHFSVQVGQPVMTAIGSLAYHDFGRGSTQQASYAYFLNADGKYASYNISFNTGFVTPNGMTVIFQDWSLGNNPAMTQRATYLVRNVAVPGVPEPASWGMLIGGFAMLGASLRRNGGRRDASAFVS